MNPAFSTTDLTKVYQMGEEQVVALNKISIEVPQGDYLAIMGPSGSGKVPLLNLLGCLDQPTEGSYELAGYSVGSLDDDELSKLRAQQIGFIFQSYNLIPLPGCTGEYLPTGKLRQYIQARCQQGTTDGRVSGTG